MLDVAENPQIGLTLALHRQILGDPADLHSAPMRTDDVSALLTVLSDRCSAVSNMCQQTRSGQDLCKDLIASGVSSGKFLKLLHMCLGALTSCSNSR